MRLDKYLAKANLGSRKQVKELIRKKKIQVNGVIVQKDDIKIDEYHDEIRFNDEVIVYQQYVYYMLNKPQGVVSATYDENCKTVMECFDEFLGDDVFPVGRLDKDTEGLLLVSNDGQLAHHLLSLKNHVDKTYYVLCKNKIDDGMVEGLQKQIVLQDAVFQPAKVEVLSDYELHLTIQEGKFHQIKRMLHHVGNEVVYLKRIRFGSLVLDENLQPGEYRMLSEDEIRKLGGKV